jgi:NAD(P)H-flavin reductase
MLPELYTIQNVFRETHVTSTLVLRPQGHPSQHGFLPGQFSMLYVFGVGEIPISISGDPAQPEHLVYTVRSVGLTTHMLITRKRGESIGVRGPFGSCWPVEEAKGKDVILVAGGIGLAPLRPVIYHVLRHRDDYGRLIILYGARTPQDMLFSNELRSWSMLRDTEVRVTVDAGDRNWRGNVGVVPSLLRSVQLRPERSVPMICGPETMMKFVVRELELRGLGASQIYLSMERSMKCGVGFCGHCQYGPHFICKDGPVFRYDRVRALLEHYEL